MGETPSKKCIFFIKGCGPGVSDTSAYICQDSVRIAVIYQKYRNPILANVTAAKAKIRHFSMLRNNTQIQTFVSFHQFPKKAYDKCIFDEADADADADDDADSDADAGELHPV